MIGLDLDDRYAQISYLKSGAKAAVTLTVQGNRQDNRIPALMAWYREKKMWVYGQEAVRLSSEGEAAPVDRLLSRAMNGESVSVSGRETTCVSLLALFIKQCLSLLRERTSLADSVLMLTIERVEGRVRRLTEEVADRLGFSRERILCQSRAESFYYYTRFQPEELWKHSCAALDLGGEVLTTMLLEADRTTQPIQVRVRTQEWPQVRREPGMARMQELFREMLSEFLGGRRIDTVYLLGDGFEGSWYHDSLPLLCEERRVFRGNNLYSKGACYGAGYKLESEQQTLDPEAGGERIQYLSGDQVWSDVELEAQMGSVSYRHPLLTAGENWFEAKSECEFILGEDHAFSLRISPLGGKHKKEVVVTLDGVPERPPKTTRIRLTLHCRDAETVCLHMEDEGFGEYFPRSGKIWDEEFSL